MRQRRGTLAIVLLGMLLLASCNVPSGSSAPSSSANTSLAPAATGSSTPPSASPTTSPGAQVVFAPPGVLPPGSRAVVTVADLRLRETPSLAGRVIAAMGSGESVWAGSFFPFQTEVDGTTWHAVAYAEGHADWPEYPESWDGGWAAGGRADDPYLALVSPRCPVGEPDLSALTAILPWERLACLGDKQVTATGTWGARGCGGTSIGNFEPRWLAYPIVCEWLRVEWPNGAILELRIPPDSGIEAPAGGSIAQVTGHFDDTASSTCAFDGAGLVPDIDEEIFELYCREQFVVDAYEVLGTDPNFPP
jgi:hypothetical protein